MWRLFGVKLEDCSPNGVVYLFQERIRLRSLGKILRACKRHFNERSVPSKNVLSQAKSAQNTKGYCRASFHSYFTQQVRLCVRLNIGWIIHTEPNNSVQERYGIRVKNGVDGITPNSKCDELIRHLSLVDRMVPQEMVISNAERFPRAFVCI